MICIRIMVVIILGSILMAALAWICHKLDIE